MAMERHILVVTEATSSSIIADTGDRAATELNGSRAGDDIGGGFGGHGEPASPARTVSLSASGLKEQISNLIEVVEYAFDQPVSSAALALDQIELSAEITSEGEIRIFGSGGKLGGRGAIRMVFKRKPADAAHPAVT